MAVSTVIEEGKWTTGGNYLVPDLSQLHLRQQVEIQTDRGTELDV